LFLVFCRKLIAGIDSTFTSFVYVCSTQLREVRLTY
jgi:hypothetical protein